MYVNYDKNYFFQKKCENISGGFYMKNEELIKLRENYNELINEKNKILALKSKIEELENNPVVKEYLDTISEYEKNKAKHIDPIEQEEDSYFVRVAVSRTDITPRDDYYVYMGTYKYTNEIDIIHAAHDIRVNRDDKDADYVVYSNLEAKSHSFDGTVEIPYSKVDEFESTHKIIVPKNVVSRDSYFYNLQEEYYETAILESEDKAIEKVNRLVRKYK